MKMHRIKISIIAALCATGTYAEVINLEPVSVTGTKSEEKVIDQALSISTKEESEIKLDQVIVQKDLLNSIAGVQIEQTGSVIGHTTAIRMPENKSSYYLFMQDGIPVQSSGFFNHNGLAYTTYQSATSVEVLKGAGTALYGSDAVAAVINVESLKKPSKEQEISLKGMEGSYGFASGSVEMSDTIDGTSAYRANVGYMHSDGWRDHTSTDRIEANLRYDQEINDENELKIIFNTSKTDAEQADSFHDYENIENVSKDASDDADYFAALDATDIKREFDYARLSAEWSNYSFDNLEISLTPYLRYNRNRYVATWEGNYPSSDNTIQTAGLMEKNTYDASWGRLITGFDGEYTQSSLNYAQDFDITTTGFGGATYTTGKLYDYDVDYMAIAPYIHTEYDITEAMMLTAGLRYDYNHYDYQNNLADNTTDPSGVYFRPADRTDSFSHLSPKLSLQYQADKDINIYARYANGFRIPQAVTLYSMKAGYSQVELDPEISDTFEIGIKKLFAEKSFLEIALYYMTVDDTITSYRVGGTRYYANGGETIHQGIEATLNTQITDEWGTHIAYSYSKHNYVDDTTFNDNEIAQAPNHLANVRLIYTPSAVNGLRIMGEWQYVGSYWMNDLHETNPARGINHAKYGGYSIGNLKADYRYDDHISIFGKVNNITDEAYAVSASSKYSDAFSPGDPRQFYAGLEYRW